MKCVNLIVLGIMLVFFGFETVPLYAAAAKPCRVELAENWKLKSSKDLQPDGTAISVASYNDDSWYPIHRMPATVLEILQEDGVYPDLYVGKNLLEKVPQDLYMQDWWYRTTFDAPVNNFYTLEFKGINYRAEIWLNGEKIADNKHVAGMYAAHELNVTSWIKPGSKNVLAVKVTPEQLIQDVTGVELADSWFDWLNWKYVGYKGPKEKNPWQGVSFVPDRNAGIWKPVYLQATGSVSINSPLVNSKLSLADSIARLTVFATLQNLSTQPVNGMLKGTISRQGKPSIYVEQFVALSPGENREVEFIPEKYSALIVSHPDLWWPYTMGMPALYDLQLEFEQNEIISDDSHIRFGIRSITQHRDCDEHFPDMGKGGNFYLKVNGRDFLVRGGDYTPDLLYRYDPEREADILRYVKDLGINFLRWESKISSEHIIELADEQGIPIMFGWMCCNQWEKWDQWNKEDHSVASQSLRSQILMLRPHASVFIWSNASDGLPPEPICQDYNKTLAELHWQNVVVNTVSAFARDADGNRIWDGIRMEGPYCWRPPSYWFSGKYPATCGSTVEQGDNEQIPTLESLRKFIPEDKLWPINDTWFMHAGAWAFNSTLGNIQLALEKRYGASTGIEDFVRKAQLAHYENARAQFESFAACRWATHKMTAYWMLNSHWPSFYGNLIDYYMSPGGVYFGAKKGLRPLSVVFDSYATGDNSQARIIVFNQTPGDVHGLSVRIRVYDLDGKVYDDRSANGILVPFNGTNQVMLLPRYPESSPVFFVRCQLFDNSGRLLVDNTYWKSQKDDDLGERANDIYMTLKQEKWADMTALNTMPAVNVEIEVQQKKVREESHVAIRLHNPSTHIAFFERATISTAKEGNEILPIEYSDNYVTVFPGETVEIHGIVRKGAEARWVKLEGYNTPPISVPIKYTFEAETAKLIGGASKVADGEASGGFLVSLTKPDDGIRFSGLPASGKLAIRYSSLGVGLISVTVNDQPVQKLYVHSSGNLSGSFLIAIADVAIPANALVTISLVASDITVNVDKIIVGDNDLGLPPDIWNLPPLPVATGQYPANWKGLSRLYTVPEWWREAKFGAWAHWDPQSMPEQGDWYARGMYMQGSWQYEYNLRNFGHPSEHGYKDICHNWVIDRWKPDELMDLFVEMGARYFMAMGVHHDNFDCWNSAYQPWNSVNVGPRQDIVGTWEKVARQHGLRFGIGFHNSPPRTWGQFMTVRYTNDKTGPMKGVPYDALQTIWDGKGKWWEGLDPVDLYGPVHDKKDPLNSPFANQFMWRVDDAITKYHPDVIYFDEAAGDTLLDLGVQMGLGFLAPPLVANFYNKSLKWNLDKMDVVINLKCVGGRYDSFKKTPELIPIVERALVKSTEADIEPEIMAYPFQTETSLADWHYKYGQKYLDAGTVIKSLLQNVSRNGSMLLNITQHGRGDLDPEVILICKDIGAWLKVNGEAIYGSRPFEIYGDNSVCYTRNNSNVYATLVDWKGSSVTLKALGNSSSTLGKVSKVEMLGSDSPLTFVQDEKGLTVTFIGSVQPLSGISDQILASRFRVLRVTHDKGWINDDDPGTKAPGWLRRCNLGTGDFNNDLTTSDTPGDIWSCSFTGNNVSVIAPKEAGSGKIEVQIDGKTQAKVDLSTTEAPQRQQMVFKVTDLTPGKHVIDIVNRGLGPVAVDAILVQ